MEECGTTASQSVVEELKKDAENRAEHMCDGWRRRREGARGMKADWGFKGAWVEG
jgi:hypothetical protein